MQGGAEAPKTRHAFNAGVCVVTLFALTFVLTSVAQDSSDPLRVALSKRIDEAKHGTGAVVGVLTPQGPSFLSYGRASIGGAEITAETIFEIGSIGKIFTAFLLADMVERGEVALNDPVRKYLPSSVTIPARRGKEILLVDLATHTSGLPRDSVEVDLSQNNSPYVGYTADDLYAFLKTYRLERDPGSKYEYSNIGVGLLGHTLALRAGMNYEDLLRRRILEPLGMTSTTITFNASLSARRATGHNARLFPVPPWTGGVLAPTGGVNSTAEDVLKFAAAVVDSRSPMKAAFARMTSVRRPIPDSRTQQTLGWSTFKRGSSELLAHDGGTFGFQSRLVVDTTRKRAVIVLINGRSEEALTEIVSLALDRDTLR